jgi:hypothetical protein
VKLLDEVIAQKFLNDQNSLMDIRGAIWRTPSAAI